MIEFIQKGGPVMVPLLVCSFLAVAFIAERSLFWWQQKRRFSSKNLDQFLEHLRHGRLKEMLKQGEESPDSVVKVLTASLGHGERVLHDALGLEVDRAVEMTQRGLRAIDTVITLSPLLGIFGTVTGIIQSFDLLGQTSIADPQAVSVGIAQALITTAAGLAIAMPSIIAYNFFLSQTERFAFRLEKYAYEFEILYAQYQQKKHGEP
ncbi:MAG: MotA/TolQ/ExbB proton channel family protein [Candidatus Omnitrophica bacterium]|nr:MotA/TolQ/ExbB proton channel family protein [Candidatus Omnitrophota bacterium]